MPKHKTDGGDHSATAKKAKHDSEVVDLSGVSDEVLLAEVVKRGVNEQLQHRVVEKQVADNYEIGNELGHGASATVYKALHKFSSDAFAVKVIDKAGELNDDETMEAELSILKSLQHRNLVNLHEMYESPTTLWLVMELVGGGDLRHAVGSLTHFDEKFVRDVARQVSDGLHYMHSCGVVHRDIKPENILRVSSAPDSVVKIADFGISARLPTFSKHAFHPNESQRRKGSSTLSDVWGTPQYFAPELIKGAYSSQVDMWALGAMLYEMLTGHICFCPELEEDIDNGVEGAEDKLYDTIGKGLPMDAFIADRWTTHISKPAQEFLRGLLVVDPRHRLSASTALQHSWLTNAKTETEADSAGLSHHLHVAHERLKQRLKSLKRRGRAGIAHYFLR